jgi:hypothetical protein
MAAGLQDPGPIRIVVPVDRAREPAAEHHDAVARGSHVVSILGRSPAQAKSGSIT